MFCPIGDLGVILEKKPSTQNEAIPQRSIFSATRKTRFRGGAARPTPAGVARDRDSCARAMTFPRVNLRIAGLFSVVGVASMRFSSKFWSEWSMSRLWIFHERLKRASLRGLSLVCVFVCFFDCLFGCLFGKSVKKGPGEQGRQEGRRTRKVGEGSFGCLFGKRKARRNK